MTPNNQQEMITELEGKLRLSGVRRITLLKRMVLILLVSSILIFWLEPDTLYGHATFTIIVFLEVGLFLALIVEAYESARYYACLKDYAAPHSVPSIRQIEQGKVTFLAQDN